MTASNRRRVAVVTGATGGIGQAICLYLAAEGYQVIGQYRDRHHLAEDLTRRIKDRGGDCIMILGDISLAAQFEHFIEEVDEELSSHDGELRALVNNAAKLLGPSFEDTTRQQFDEYFALNTQVPLLLSQRLALRMESGGSIVNVSSAGVHFSSPGDIVYAMSKAALEALTYHAAEALARRNIRINTVIPGFTNNGHDLFNDPEVRAYMGSFAALGGVGSPEDVAEAVGFLISDVSLRTTGSTLDVSGGSNLGARPPSTFSIKRAAGG